MRLGSKTKRLRSHVGTGITAAQTRSRRKRKAALNAKKAAEAKLAKDLDSKGMPKVNLFRFLPQQEKKATRTTDGSFVFPKPWGKGYFDK